MNLKNTFSRIVICLLLTLSTIICNNPFYQIKAIAANNEAISTDTDTWNYEQIVSDDPLNLLPVLEEVIDSINNKDWFRFTSYMTDEQEAFFDWYFSNNYYNNGIKQIEQIQIRNAVLLNKNAVETELLYDEYPSMKQSEELHPYLVSLDCTVSEENVFFYNGTNYFLFVIEKTSDGTYKVAQFNRASYELSYLVEENSKSGIDTSEKKGLNVLKRAEQGLITNASGRLLNEGCNLKQIKTKSITTKNTCISFSNYSEHTKLEGGFFISIPTEISVKLNSGKIVTPTLASYIKNTLPNEWYGSDDKDALIAGYFCVKGVALYRSLRPINSSYMVSTGTQAYEPNSSYSKTNKVANSYSDQYMLSSEGCLFFPEYGAGNVGEKGKKSSDRLLINGSRYMASNGASYKKILNYYYKGGQISSDNIKYVSYGSIFRYYV